MATRGESQLPADRMWQFVTDTRGRFAVEAAVQPEPTLIIPPEAAGAAEWVPCFDPIYSQLIESKSGQDFQKAVDLVADVELGLREWQKAEESKRESLQAAIQTALEGLQTLDEKLAADARACAKQAGFPI